MPKNDDSFEKQLHEVQENLAEPSKKIVGALSSYLNFLNPLSKNDKNNEPLEKRPNVKQLKYNNITWIDIENPNRSEINKLAEEYPFHPLHLEASLLKGQLPQMEKEDKYIFLLLHIPSHDPKNNPKDNSSNKVITNQVVIFLGKNYLITIHEDTENEIRQLFKSCEDDETQRDTYFKKSAGYLLYNIIDNSVKDLSNLVQSIYQELDEIEDLVFDVRVSGVYKIGELRQKIIRVRRIISLLKKILESLTTVINDFTGDSLQRYFGNITKTINKLWETIEEARETVEIYKDADFTVSTERTNKTLSILTIIFTLTIPTTIIGTFYGMNILLPGGIEAGSWFFWGPYTTFILVAASSFLAMILMLVFFKFKNWF